VLKTTEFPEDRRRFLTGAIYAIGSLIGGALFVPAATYLFGKRKTSDWSRWVDAGELRQMPTGTPREISFRRNQTDGWKIRSEKQTAWIVKQSDGKLVAFSPWCTHLGCAYRWDAERNEFACPCHGSFFWKNGDVIAGPAPRPLDRYEIRLTGNRIWLGSLKKTQET
jgi:menaquinol-cytochrome c reductase iron-sulfur subunit